MFCCLFLNFVIVIKTKLLSWWTSLESCTLKQIITSPTLCDFCVQLGTTTPQGQHHVLANHQKFRLLPWVRHLHFAQSPTVGICINDPSSTGEHAQQMPLGGRGVGGRGQLAAYKWQIIEQLLQWSSLERSEIKGEVMLIWDSSGCLFVFPGVNLGKWCRAL